ncbi:MAG TPA: GNAT family N-acetyltransferase [Longimicrobiales bacterium]|nr:GNAT family N-acetyltransferase [Longimicrobiales bacterium]
MALRLESTVWRPDLWDVVGPSWTYVFGRLPGRSVFLSPPWIASWLHTFGPDLEPSAWVWRDGSGTPVACALVTTVHAWRGPLRVRRLHLNASGGRQVICEHNELLAVPAWRDAALTELIARIQDAAPDELVLTGFKAELVDQIRARWPGPDGHGFIGEAPYVDLAALRREGRDYLEALSANTRANLRRSFRAYETRFGPPAVEVVRHVAPDDPWFVEMVALHEARWRRKGLPGAFAAPLARRFYAELARRCAGEADREGQPRLELLRVRFGDETVGFLFNVVFDGVVSFYQSGLNYHEGSSLYRPGMVSHALAVAHYLARGAREYDFLGGEPSGVQYKRSLSTASRPLAWLRLSAPTVKMRALDVLRRGWWRLRSGSMPPPRYADAAADEDHDA